MKFAHIPHPLLFLFAASIPTAAYADLYRYQTREGEIILTTEPRKDLKLLEVIRDNASKSSSHSKSSAGTASNGSSGHSPKAGVSPAQAPASNRYDDYIAEASEKYQIPTAFIRAVIKIESNFNPRAVSRVGAMGLMQLMPETARHMQVDDPFDPRQNIMGGTRYLRRLSDRYDGDINLVLSGYHAGPGNVEKAGGIPFEKTQQYVRNVYGWYLKYQAEEKSKAASH